jgi:predicted Zn-dependent protease
MTVTFRVIDTGKIAFTFANGYRYISRGLPLQLNSEAELAAVLAQGMARTALRSATKEATQANVTQLATIPAMISLPHEWPVRA